ncbi:TIGR00297 family protein [Candidatus Kryptobacter tengchongensis]|nr:TIGR00297 family protein [Candidatus Kryptobacter tengchongensis]
MDWINAILLVLGIFGVIGVSEVLRKIFKFDPEVTRKVVHITVGVAVFPAPVIFKSIVPVVVIALFFIVVNFLSLRFKVFKGMDSIERQTYGTVYYPLAFLILVLVFWGRNPAIISISMLILALGDAFAAIVGEGIKNPKLYNLTGDKKSVQGSSAMFLISFLVVLIFLSLTGGSTSWWGNNLNLTFGEIVLISILTALFVSVVEGLGSYGFDNLFIPLASAFMLYSLVIVDKLNQFLLGFILALLISVISYRLKFLTLNGAVATFLLAVIIFGSGGWKWTVPILTFFVLSSLISKIGKKRRKKFDLIFEKTSTRDIYQVLANGGIAGVIALIYNFYPEEILYYMYLASVSAATFDTWATEIGTLLLSRPRLITNFKPVEPGTSGGVSFKGTIGGIIGSVLIFSSATLWVKWNLFKLVSIIFAGFVGSFVDSLLGATLQAQYKCNACSKVTEKKFHCDGVADLIRGKSWVNNDFVNFICTASGALTGLVIVVI